MKKLFKNTKKFILYLALYWRIFLAFCQIIGGWFLSFQERFSYLSRFNFENFFWGQWANFDGVHYLAIAQDSYLTTGFVQAFFPLYPLLLRWLGGGLASGLLISHLFFILSLFVFYKLIRLDFNKKTAINSILFLVLFPTSFYLVAVYNESLFLFLSLAAFLAMRKKRWFLSALLIGLSSATRITGIFLVPALVYEYITRNFKIQITNDKQTSKSKYIKLIILSLISVSGWLFYSLYLNKHFNDPFLYAHVQQSFGAQRTTDKLILPYQVIWRYLKMIFTVQKNSWLYYSVWLEFLSSLSALGLLIWGFFRKIRKSYLIYALPALLLPTLTGTFSSMPRYVLILFPIFMVLGQIKSKWVRGALLILSTGLLVLSTALFTQGYWLS